MRDAVDVAEFHDAVRQQPQRPLRVPLRRFATTEGDQVRLELPVGLALIARTPALPAAERRLHPLLHEASLHPIHLPRADPQNLGDHLATHPVHVELPFVAVEQDQRVDHLLRPVRTLARNGLEFLPLLPLQCHYVALHCGLLAVPGRRGNRQ